MFAGYGGVPYTYPSNVAIKKAGLHDVTVEDVAWDGEPFRNPIYYGARIVRFGGGRFGTMLDFTHSKAIARLAEEATFDGTLNGAPAKGWQSFADPREACAGADLVTTDVWTSMGYEAENEARRKAFAEWCVDADMMAAARPDALFMHCLPAHRGEEVTAEVIDGPQSVVWDEAENRMHVQKALLEYLLLGRLD